MLVMLALSSARLLHNLPPELATMLALAAQRIEKSALLMLVMLALFAQVASQSPC